MDPLNNDCCSCSPERGENDPCYSESNYSSSKKQSLICCLAKPHYGSLINADGHAEVWTDWNDISKFFQYGWRCSTNEDAYSIRTLMGNWNQERFDIKYIIQPKPLPSQFGHYFETTYGASYNSQVPIPTHRYIRESHWFPGHQPELEPPQPKCTEKSNYQNSYVEPQIWHQSSSCVCYPKNCPTEGQGF
ncbi:cilia- and flagella-associated protein 68 isoform X2 [Sorex fumeus]|uniref:cilia- and flagella-associated protein 68 isoform X2 n=1 Tax=Sorex fumeus TaxID=62283 RepID=UPI0024AC9A33|nr:cilia- and flagella-associated protein 68 isoform X2 [Sorex fumeus]